LEGLRGADLEKKCNRLSAFGVNSQVDEALQSQARRLADGNPRLLEWLDKVLLNLDPPQPPFLRGEQNTVAEILARLEADPVELREQVLAEALLEQIDKPLEEMLQRGLVFELPVPREAIAAVCESIPNLDQQINRAVALGLLEVSPDESLRVPRILEKNLTPQPPSLPGKGEKERGKGEKERGKGENVSSFTPAEDAQQGGNRENNSSFAPLLVGEGLGERLYQQAAEVLYRLWWYRLWWQEAETSTEEQQLEIHRLALRGKVETIAVAMAATLANRWKNQSRYREAVELCKATLEITQDYRVLHGLARSEQELGEVGKAQTYYQQALDSCPQDDETEKAAIIHNLASLKANSGQIEDAIALYQQSLDIKEGIGNVQGKAATLHQLASLKANTGQIEQAIALYQQSLDIKEGIGNAQGKAATLHQLASLKANTGQIE
jgi:tetratricopeptide (TPR) repeat protein